MKSWALSPSSDTLPEGRRMRFPSCVRSTGFGMNTSTPPIRSTSLPDVFPADVDDALQADPGELLDLLRAAAPGWRGGTGRRSRPPC